ncbi:GH25 family lysozyme [Terrilactibacillus sp. S3-3]|nr:GH25 family lysozyme [Terrilactibacillus sp. S3-3]
MEKIADISQYQPQVDYKKLKTAVQLVIIRVQFGSKKIDPLAAAHTAGCKKAGLPFGHYAFSQFVSSADAVREADDFCRRADKEAVFLVLDAEQKTCTNMAGACQAFIDECHHNGWNKVGLYSSQAFYQANGLSKVNADFIWLARYGSNNGLANKKPDIPPVTYGSIQAPAPSPASAVRSICRS